MPLLPDESRAVVLAAVIDISVWDEEGGIGRGVPLGCAVLEECDLEQRPVLPPVAPQHEGVALLQQQARGLQQQPV